MKTMKMILLVMISIITISCEKSPKVTTLEKNIEGNWKAEHDNEVNGYRDGVVFDTKLESTTKSVIAYYVLTKDSILFSDYPEDDGRFEVSSSFKLELLNKNTMIWYRPNQSNVTWTKIK